MFRRLILLSVLLALSALPAAAAAGKSYDAERFDVEWALTEGGVLEVRETVVFRFAGGPFTYVYRELPRDYSDGVEIVQAAMDGRTLPSGDQAGQVEIKAGDPLVVTWRFAPASDAAHTFVLTYRVLGVVRQEEGADLFWWNALPTEYEYRIASTTVRLAFPEGITPAGPAEVRRGRAQVSVDPGSVTFAATHLGPNTPLTVAVPFPVGSLISAAPAWQQRAQAQQEALPGLAGGALALLAAGSAGLYGVWVRGRRAADIAAPAVRTSVLPGDLAPAVAGLLTSTSGRPGAPHALGALFDLAQRGLLTIEEAERRAWYVPRDFVVRQVQAEPASLRPHEAGLLDLMFSTKSGRNETVRLSELRSRLSTRLSRFADPLKAELDQAGLVDPARQAGATRFSIIGVVLLGLMIVLLVVGIVFVRRFGAGFFLLPAAALLLSIAAFVLAAAYSPLSDAGAREASRWVAFKTYLSDVTRDREPAWDLRLFARYLPYAAAFGLVEGWAKAFQRRGGAEIPDWFRAVAGSADGGVGAFVAMTGAAHSAGSSGSGGAGGGGAGGGGGSGAG